jgi:replicative DNA helicase
MGLRPDVFEDRICESAFSFTMKYWFDSGMERAPTVMVLERECLHVEPDPQESVSWLVSTLQKRYVSNRLQEMLYEAGDASLKDPVSALKKLYATAYDAAEVITPRQTRVDMADSINDRRRRYEERNSHPGGLGLPYGIAELDQHTGGLMPGELGVIGAFSKVGKSFFLCNTLVHLRRAGYTPILFTLEMSIGEIEERIDALYSGVSYNRLIHATLKPEEQDRLHAAQEEMALAGPVLVESPEEGERTVAHLINRARQAGADYVLIDQLSFMEAVKATRTPKEHHAEIMHSLKNEIRRPGREIPCLMAVQLNRDSINQGAQLRSFANASEVERYCDIALGLERSEEERINHVMKCHILGSRRSDNKSWLLNWELLSAARVAVLNEL